TDVYPIIHVTELKSTASIGAKIIALHYVAVAGDADAGTPVGRDDIAGAGNRSTNNVHHSSVVDRYALAPITQAKPPRDIDPDVIAPHLIARDGASTAHQDTVLPVA